MMWKWHNNTSANFGGNAPVTCDRMWLDTEHECVFLVRHPCTQLTMGLRGDTTGRKRCLELTKIPRPLKGAVN